MTTATRLLLSSAFLLVGLACAQSTPTEAPSISPAELAKLQAEGSAPVVIDVRSAEEYALGHVPGAIHIPFQEIAERISEVDAPNGVALYCMVGPRARKGESALFEAGYTDVLHLDGGFSAWQAAGFDAATGN